MEEPIAETQQEVVPETKSPRASDQVEEIESKYSDGSEAKPADNSPKETNVYEYSPPRRETPDKSSSASEA